EQMQQVGMDTKYVKVMPGSSTLFSVCFQYPDKTGGNITTSNSASALVTANDIDEYFTGATTVGKEIVLSVPEVPLTARIRLLEQGRKRNSLNVASLLSGEVTAFREQGGFALTDILSVNIDEAEKISGVAVTDTSKATVIEQCVQVLRGENPSIAVLITDGADGVYAFSRDTSFYQPAYRVTAVSTAGAGDAFLAGTICGLCCGLPLYGNAEERDLPDAIALGSLLAAFSVTSPDTIHLGVNAANLKLFSEQMSAGKWFAPLFRNACASQEI
ncbi:MAG: PfkB family carbohydrate kinase, partial [Niabella sp.]